MSTLRRRSTSVTVPAMTMESAQEAAVATLTAPRPWTISEATAIAATSPIAGAA